MGADMTEGTIVRWLKAEGDAIERGEIIAEIETDKANVEIEAFESGVFGKILHEEGDTIDVGTVIAVIASPDEDLSRYSAAAPAAAKPAPQAAPAAASPTPAPAPADHDGRVRASPVARKLAEERGVDLTSVRGTGPDGRIVRRDVEAAAAGGGAAAPASAPTAGTVVPMSRMRQTIARRMSQSKQQAPHYYITADIDVTEAERERHAINDAHDRRELHVLTNDFVVKACALALQKHAAFNALFVDGQVILQEPLNICIAIALDEGLIAPALLDCRNKSLAEIATASRDLATRAKGGALKPEEYSGGTFTISNLGLYHVETLIAIIQPPQTAILGVGSVRETPIVRDGKVEVGKLMKVALSADHRATDGEQGARFLNEIRRLLEKPAALLS
jgi:pyruvate dehydrogenase E2 component (dihydrolipoamide acetyltransferase)